MQQVGTNPLKNTGTITVGNNGIGMYGLKKIQVET